MNGIVQNRCCFFVEKYNYYLNPWVQRECRVQDIDSDSVMKNRSHTHRSGEIFHIAG